jgi:LPXTG-site transpeptidase (sortase) family protein
MVGAVITAIGVFLAMLVLFLYAFTPLTAARDQHRLLATLTGSTKTDAQSTFALTNGVLPPEGSAIALLRIPALHLSRAVVAGTSAVDLQSGPGLMPQTAIPGTAGNTVIAGRRVMYGGPFGSLATLRSGDTIRITDGLGTFRYTVRSVRTVLSGAPDVIGPAATNRLTLITSDSSFVTTGRLVVVASLRGLPVRSPVRTSKVVPLLGLPVTSPTEASKVADGELGLSGDPSAGGGIVLWSGLLLLVAGATGWAVWRWRRPWPTYLLAAPVLVACGLFAAQAVAMALPATL